MLSTTPAQARYTTFSCPTPDCTQFNRLNVDTIVHRSWTGKHQHSERLRCTACDREFSERAGTLMARSKLAEDKGERRLKWQRWGICDEGTADIGEVALKTVYRCQRVAAQRAQTHHQQGGRDVDVPGGQWDEAHAKLRPKQVEWVHTAGAMGSWFLLWGDCGPRTQEQAAGLIAQVVARTRQLPLCLSDGWKPYIAALLQVLGVMYRPRRRGKVGRKPKPRLVAPKQLCYALGRQSPPRGRPRGGGPQTRDLGWSPALCQAASPAAIGRDDPDGVYGTVGWYPARVSRPPTASPPVFVLEPSSPPRTGMAGGQPLQFRAAAQKPTARPQAAHTCYGHRSDRARLERAGV